MKVWFEIISELFVNLAAGWFAIVLIEPQFGSANPILLTGRLISAIFSLVSAKFLREGAKR